MSALVTTLTAFVVSGIIRTPHQVVNHRFGNHLTVNTMTSSSSPSSETTYTKEQCGIDFPELVVFDLDACLWNKEMFEMTNVPGDNDVVLGDLNGRGEGVIGVMSGRSEINLNTGSLIGLQEHADGKYPGMKVVLASSADTPFAEKVGRSTLKKLEVIPGMTIWDLLMRDWNNQDINQIGRQPPLSSNKAKTHLPFIRKLSGVRYDKMLFFDDCNWGDHCGMVQAACKEDDNGNSPSILRTPYGLGEKEWYKGLKVYANDHK